MRTTIRLDESLLNEARRVAAERRVTLTQLLDQAIQEFVARERETPARMRLPTFSGDGLQPDVDLDDTASLLDVMDRPVRTTL